VAGYADRDVEDGGAKSQMLDQAGCTNLQEAYRRPEIQMGCTQPYQRQGPPGWKMPSLQSRTHDDTGGPAGISPAISICFNCQLQRPCAKRGLPAFHQMHHDFELPGLIELKLAKKGIPGEEPLREDVHFENEGGEDQPHSNRDRIRGIQ
jgi:hypothetical protein